MRIFILVSVLLLTAWLGPVLAQPPVFLMAGKVEFEKKLNMYDEMKDYESDTWTDIMKKAVPKFRVDYFNMVFTADKSLYQPGRENPENIKIPEWMQDRPGENNTIFTDFQKSSSISQKKVYDQVFIIEDSVRKIKWKITDETRTIAGFVCRRANGIAMDSIYVVAFYTDEIVAPGGPESFNGLPGMILGVALPHEHVSWFATKVEAVEPRPADFSIPAKGKKVSRAALLLLLNDRMKDWGKSGKRTIQKIML